MALDDEVIMMMMMTMVMMMMIKRFERMWKEITYPKLKYCPGNLFRGIQKWH
jgi:hypothetical protein